MNILAIETSGRAASIAIARGDDVVERPLDGPTDQVLMSTILDLAELAALDGIAIGLGPGMFTGMRVGIATGKTLAAALGLRVAGVSSLDLIARAAIAEGTDMVAARADAGRGEVYAATYHALPFRRMSEIEIVRADEFAPPPGAVVADGAPRAAMLASVAVAMFERGETMAPNDVEPLYVRRTDAEINWERRGGIARPGRVKARGE